MNVAKSAEESVTSLYIQRITIGFSTGTSGNKGVFMVSNKERAMWVAIIIQQLDGNLEKKSGLFSSC